jgi:hypothetical protein
MSEVKTSEFRQKYKTEFKMYACRRTHIGAGIANIQCAIDDNSIINQDKSD